MECPQLSSQLAVYLQSYLLRHTPQFLLSRDGPGVDHLTWNGDLAVWVWDMYHILTWDGIGFSMQQSFFTAAYLETEGREGR